MTAWLLTWLWQGVALAVSLSIALHLLPRVNAATRYVLWWGAFGVLIFLGWPWLPHAAIAGSFATAASVAAASAPAPAVPAIALIKIQPLPSWALSLIGTMWASVALFRLLRIVPGLNHLYRLKDECRPFPRGVEEQLPLWLESKGRRVRLMLCDRVPGAAVLGLHDPYIALPLSIVSELSAVDLDQIILHEYGHVQRRDDWARLLQTLLESALWMHPAAFLIGRELNLEREVACDDWVIAKTGSPKRYAGCLSRVAEQRRARVAPALSQALFGGHRELFRRVDRLLNTRRNVSRTPSLTTAAIGAAALIVCALQLRAFPLVTDVAMMPTTTTVVSDSRTTAVAASVADEAHKPDVQPQVRLKRSAAGKTVGSEAVHLEAVPSEMVGLRPVSLKADTVTATATAPATVAEARGAPTEMFETQILQGTRAFEGVYQLENTATVAPPVMTPWQLVGDAGVGIGAATRKASVGLANSFTKAGTAIARSF